MNRTERAKQLDFREKHQSNVRNVLMYSNATMIRSCDDNGYKCGFCRDQYTTPADLKEHSLNSHTRNCLVDMKVRSPYTVKLDITDLKCTICNSNTPTLQDLLDHLQNSHDKVIYEDIENQLVSYKFDDDKFRCVFCKEEFRTFPTLQFHMNKHYPNYECDVCHAGFMNNNNLRWHKKTHKRQNLGKKIGKSKDMENEDDCAENEEIEDRNETLTENNLHICSECDAYFENEELLRNHALNEHSLKRDYNCEDCDMTFLTADELKHHQQSHREFKQHQCYLCLSSFKDDKTLHDHLIIHANGVGFKCTECDLSFVHEKEMQEHIQEKHGTPETNKKVDSKNKKNNKVKSSDVAGKKMGRSALQIKFRENVLEVLYNSNASAIRSCVDYRYTCCFCSDCYERPEDLKNHNLECHDKSTLRNGIRANHLNSLTLKLDITGLRCTLCDTKMDMLDDLLNHLKDIHNRQIHTDIDNYMVPLKFEDDILRCTFCRREFVQLRLLMAHINVHYRNFVCEVCDHGFISKNIYRSHRRIHEIGNFKCDYCERVMDTRAKKLNHERVTHGRLKNFDGTASKYVNKCQYCHQTFNGYTKKQKHLAKVHGVKLPGLQCKACDRTFPNRQRYTIHIKRDHLMERRHGCTVCDMKFFTSPSLKIHMISHSGVKKYQCDICMKSYGSRRSIKTETTDVKSGQSGKLNDEIAQIGDTNVIKKKGEELAKHKINLVAILKNSTATPIRCRGGIGYACCYCAQEFPDPKDLKKHTMQMHEEKTRLRLMEGKDIYKFHAKLDITDLKCSICASNIDDLEKLIEHLRNVHNVTMHMDVKNQLVPFKFGSEGLKCFMCFSVYHKFKSLLEHMNVHYRNYICDVCNAGFVNRCMLARHAESHRLGSFKCMFCPKIFDTLRKKRSHEKCVHTHSVLNRCGYCNEKFRDYRKKEKHLIAVHGAVNVETKCQACDRTFTNQKEYNSHVKRLHLMDKRHKCPECDMAFFTTGELRDHVVKHTGTRQFECEVCHKTYGRRKTLLEHLRIHKDDRRFKCEHCGQAFVQKCSWRGHMRKRVRLKSDSRETAKTVANENSDPPKVTLGKELAKHRTNIREIIRWSNATPIRCRGGIGYACCFCSDQYPDPADLKRHTIDGHDEETKRDFMKGKDMYGFFVKLDITSLVCNICLQNINTLENLMTHLKDEHDKNIYTDINNHILPFKFESETLKCFICLNVFNKFKALQEHMHTHYRNFICEVCDAGFVNKHLLLCHREGHKKGTFECTQCTEVFDTVRKMKQHIRKVHNGSLPHKCGYCNERFKENFHKNEHLAKVHGIVGPAIKCQACDRTFATQQTWLLHTKKYHLMQRQYKCSRCEMDFFSKRELNDHMVKHTGTREYRCEICFKCYGRLKTLKEHLRRLHPDERRRN
ncbi:unnamed protein product [Colias eurytheme]|nr:unnamed protein product [Colias eurytheme]